MSMGPVDNRLVPAFVSAGSPQGLRRAMILNNARAGSFHRYFDIQYAQGKWFAWYYREIGSEDIGAVDESQGIKKSQE